MAESFNLKENYDFNDLVEIMKVLRVNCPWDREQTHESISKNFIEETYEAVDAIRTSDTVLLREELGDVLLQVVFHAEIERQAGNFSINGVTDEICKKLIIRHPHVFGEISAGTPAQVLNNWESIKRKTKNQNTHTESLEDVPKSLPALMKAQKLQKRAKKSGFSQNIFQKGIDKLYVKILKLNTAIKNAREHTENGENNADVQDEIGDLIFTLAGISEMFSVDAETALSASCDKFIRRFAVLERQALESGNSLEDMPEEEIDAMWNKIENFCK